VIYITADLLAIGDMIIDGKQVTLVKKLEPCPSHMKGIRRIHVNSSECYDTLLPLTVRIHGGN